MVFFDCYGLITTARTTCYLQCIFNAVLCHILSCHRFAQGYIPKHDSFLDCINYQMEKKGEGEAIKKAKCKSLHRKKNVIKSIMEEDCPISQSFFWLLFGEKHWFQPSAICSPVWRDEWVKKGRILVSIIILSTVKSSRNGRKSDSKDLAGP